MLGKWLNSLVRCRLIAGYELMYLDSACVLDDRLQFVHYSNVTCVCYICLVQDPVHYSVFQWFQRKYLHMSLEHL